jgi:hypothetical protein
MNDLGESGLALVIDFPLASRAVSCVQGGREWFVD